MVNDKDEPVFGDGIAKLIEKIDQHHSVLEAAKDLGMSYRYALHRITLAEERLGQPLVNRSRGGAKGGGSSEVTANGKDLVKRYRKAQKDFATTLKDHT
jgi:molybdate transport system regulatory protein